MPKLARMLKWWLGSFALALVASAQPTSPQLEMANLREDVRGVVQRVGDLSLRVEQLEHENADLRRQVGSSERAYATMKDLNDAIAALHQEIHTATAESKSETLQQVSVQLEKLAKQTNAAIESLAKSSPVSRAPAPAAFSDEYSKEGVSYTVQKGETLAMIAKKTGAKIQDIINANKLADPSRIHAGQTLFIPGGK